MHSHAVREHEDHSLPLATWQVRAVPASYWVSYE